MDSNTSRTSRIQWSKIFKKPTKLSSNHPPSTAPTPLLFIVVFAVMGGIVFLLVTHASSPYAVLEPEQGTITSPATVGTDNAASGGSFIQFNSGVPPPSCGSYTYPTCKIHVAPDPVPPLTPCVANPHSCGFPDATNTGVPASTTLTPSGSLTITQAGTTVSGLRVDGMIWVQASNVTIKNSQLSCATCNFIIRVDPGFTNVLIEDVEAYGNSSTPSVIGGGGGYTLLRSNIHDASDGVHVGEGSTIKDTYIHDLAPTALSHDDMIQQAVAVGNLTITHNTLLPFSSTTHIYNNSAFIGGGHSNSPQSGLIFTNNLVNGGSNTVYCPAFGSNNTFSGNRWGRDYHFKPTSPDCHNAQINSFDNTNVWDDNGQTVPF